MGSQHTDGTAALAPYAATEAQVRRRTFTIVPFEHRGVPHDADPAQIKEALGLEVVEADEHLDWQLLRLIRMRDELQAAKERLAVAKDVCAHYEAQEAALTEWMLENRGASRR
jgi:hypothetical protein